MKELLVEHNKNTFHDPQKPLTKTNTIEHEIPMTGIPVRIPPRRVALGQRKIIEDEILKMEKEGTITKSSGPWCSPIVLVRRKDGTIRFCVDYRKLNDVTHKDAYPLPRIDDILDAFLGEKYFCSIDLASGYWQIKVADKDREKTAFGSHLGLYEFPCMHFGLTGDPAKFSRLIDKVLDGLTCKRCTVYLDDVIIFGSSFKETLANLKLVMSCLCEHNLLCKARKCGLFETSIAFLGHVVSEEGHCYRSSEGRENMQLISTNGQRGYKKHIATWKLLQAVHQELQCNNSPSAGTLEEICPFQVGR